MINRVLIVEDEEIANLSVQKTLEELGVVQPDYAFYCDDALAKIVKGKQDSHPYDLLITDLYFEEDHRKQQLIGGQALIAAARAVQPELKVLVFSGERRVAIVETLFTNYAIDGYVRKARNDAKELKSAIDLIQKGQRHFPWWYIDLIKRKNAYQFKELDLAIIDLLAQGISQKDMPSHLRKSKIKPSGLSSIEKQLAKIKEALECISNEQLIAYCKDTGLI